MPTENSESGNLTTRAPKFNENIREKDHNKRIQKRIHGHQQRNRGKEYVLCRAQHFIRILYLFVLNIDT